ncbi:MAG: NAD(P)-dependent oxidoreductase, partial [Burkholderiales bacterium]
MHVIFGAGQVGTPLAIKLREQGERVRVVRRAHGEIAAGAELVPGDALDPGLCARACEGARVVYH